MRKIFLIVLIVAVMGTGGFIFIFYGQKGEATELNGGRVVEVKENSIIAEGFVVYSADPAGQREFKKIEFRIVPGTVLTNRVRIITREQAESGKQFYPTDQDMPGRIEDLKSDTGIVSIKSDKDLFKTSKAAATEILYNTYELPF